MSTINLDDLCVGQCMNGYRRKVRTHQAALAQYAADMEAWHIPLVWPEPPAEPRLPYPAYGEPIYCPDCGYDIKAKLSKLDGAACVYLRESDGMRGQTDQAKVSRSSSEAPSLSPTIEDVDELDGWLRDWKAAYLGCETMARQGQLVDSITLGASWLLVRVERILAHADLAQPFGDEVGRWYGRLVRYDPSDVAVEQLKGIRCLGCNGLTLERKVGDERVTCRKPTCDRVLKFSEYQEFEREVKQARKAPLRASSLPSR